MIIVPARPVDLPQVRELLLTSIVDDHGYSYRPDWHADIDDLQGAYLDRPRAAYLVARDGDQVLGGIGLRPTAPRAPAVAQRYAGRSDVGELARLVVAPQCRRQGIAGQLVAALLASLDPSIGTVALHTNRGNAGSVAFWRSTGAEIVLDESLVGAPDPAFVALHMEYRLATPSREQS